jgi:hypothetical protein
MAIQSLPTKPVGLYWPNFGIYTARLNSYPDVTDNGSAGYNVIFLFSAYPSEGGGGDTGSVTYVRGGLSSTIWDNRIADIVEMRAKGVIVLLSIGGGGRQVYLRQTTGKTVNDAQTRADNCVASIISIISTLGEIDGIDWNNFELGGSDPEWMTYASLKLKDYYGSGFIISAPPAQFGTGVGGQAYEDREMMATMHHGGTYGSYTGTALDWMCSQQYDPSGHNTQSAATNMLNHYEGSVSVPASTINSSSAATVSIPRSKLGIGFGMQTPAMLELYPDTYSTYWTVANATSAYTNISASREVRGGFVWAAHIDPTHVFATNMGPVINPGAGGGGGNTTLTTVKRINGMLVATVKRINGMLVSAIKSRNNKQ